MNKTKWTHHAYRNTIGNRKARTARDNLDLFLARMEQDPANQHFKLSTIKQFMNELTKGVQQ